MYLGTFSRVADMFYMFQKRSAMLYSRVFRHMVYYCFQTAYRRIVAHDVTAPRDPLSN